MAAMHSSETLTRAVVEASEASHWAEAVLEWAVATLEEDEGATSVCVCGHTDLRYLYTITNEYNGAVLFPIGSVCVKRFGREDLDRQVDLLGALLRLRAAVLTGEQIELDRDHFFSRALIRHLYDEGAFTPDQWNDGYGGNDRDFLLKMFNKQNKDEITQGQHRKIRALLNRKVIPFIQAHDRLN